MKNLITTITLLLLTAITSFAQKTHYTQYNVIAQAKDVSIIVKDNDYRMVVGPLKKPKTVFLLGYSKEQAAQRLQQFIEQADNKSYSKKNRPVTFCGVNLQLTAIGSKAEDVIYDILREDNNIRFRLNRSSLVSFIDLP